MLILDRPGCQVPTKLSGCPLKCDPCQSYPLYFMLRPRAPRCRLPVLFNHRVSKKDCDFCEWLQSLRGRERHSFKPILAWKDVVQHPVLPLPCFELAMPIESTRP
jgi:hypothetical protein